MRLIRKVLCRIGIHDLYIGKLHAAHRRYVTVTLVCNSCGVEQYGVLKRKRHLVL